MRLISALLLVQWLAVTPASAQQTIVLRVVGRTTPELQRGIEFGLAEASQTAGLLGVELRGVHHDDPAGPASGIIVATSRGGSRGHDIPAVHIGGLPPDAGPCDFSLAAPSEPGPERTVVRWHPSLSRFGASELNERFARKHGVPMRDNAWAAWAAVKALVEAALRHPEANDPCRALARLRFDGHKGRPLYFDARTHVLSQPLYTVRNGRVLSQSK